MTMQFNFTGILFLGDQAGIVCLNTDSTPLICTKINLIWQMLIKYVSERPYYSKVDNKESSALDFSHLDPFFVYWGLVVSELGFG